MTTTTNGTTTRKSLASELDRLDSILDGLADGLNDAVAAVVKETVGQAVREAIRDGSREIVADPTVMAALRSTLVPAAPTVSIPTTASAPSPARPPRFFALQALLTRLRCWAAGRWQRICSWAELVWQFRTHILAILVVTVLLGVTGYWAGLIVCGAFLVGVVASAGSITIFRSWHRPQATTLQANTCSAVSSTPVPVAATAAV